MTGIQLNLVLQGGLTISAWLVGLFFLRFWKTTRDRLFLFFCAAFWLLAINWLSLAIVNWVPETRHQAYIVRLFAFAAIIVGIVDKNRRDKRRRAS